MLRRTFIMAAMTAILAGHVVPVQASSQKPLVIVVPYGPGGLPDSLARIVGQRIRENTGRPVIVENKAGASGIIGAQYFLSKAVSDGRKAAASEDMLFLIDNNTYAINPAIYPDLVYKPARDFALVTHAIEGPMYLVANANVPAKSVRDMIALAKASPGKVMYGSPGNATLHHLGMEQLGLMADVKMTHIPYKGVAQATPGLLSGDVSFMFASLTSVAPHAESGKLRILAVGSRQRSSLTPDVPTVAEEGFPGFQVATNMGFAAAAGLPRAVIDQLNEELVKALKSSEVTSKLESFGVKVVADGPDQFTEQLNKDQESYARLVRQTNLKVN